MKTSTCSLTACTRTIVLRFCSSLVCGFYFQSPWYDYRGWLGVKPIIYLPYISHISAIAILSFLALCYAVVRLVMFFSWSTLLTPWEERGRVYLRKATRWPQWQRFPAQPVTMDTGELNVRISPLPMAMRYGISIDFTKATGKTFLVLLRFPTARQ